MNGQSSIETPPTAPMAATIAPVVPLDGRAAVFLQLADRIPGSAVGWSPTAIERLRGALGERYLDVFGPLTDQAVEELIGLATTGEHGQAGRVA